MTKEVKKILGRMVSAIESDKHRSSPIGNHKERAAQDLLAHLLSLPEMQEKPGIQKGTPEWRNGDTCPDCQMVYMAELGECLCGTQNDTVFKVEVALRRELG